MNYSLLSALFVTNKNVLIIGYAAAKLYFNNIKRNTCYICLQRETHVPEILIAPLAFIIE